MYDVYLDNIYFYGVNAFNFPSDRKIIVYNGIGTGYFPKADDPNLKEWSWECRLQEFPEHYHNKDFTPASNIKQQMDEMLRKKQPVRLIMKSEYSSLSQEVLLEKYSFKEDYAGVYRVTVNVKEYKEAAIRSTDIPEIPRPGKIPEFKKPSKTPGKDNETGYDKTNEPPESWEPDVPTGGHRTEGEMQDPSKLPLDSPIKEEIRYNIQTDFFHQKVLPAVKEFKEGIKDDFFHQEVIPGIKNAYNKFTGLFKK